MYSRLFWVELKRLTLRPRYVIALICFTSIGIGLMFFGTGGLFAAPDPSGNWTAWSALFYHGIPVYILTPMFVGFITGAGLAEDYHSGYQKFIQVRVGHRIKSLTCKTSAIAFASFLGFFVSFCILAFSASLICPVFPIDPSVVTLDNGLFSFHPFLYLFILAITAGLGAAAMASVSCFVSIWVKNPYVVGATPIGYLFGSILLEGLIKVRYLSIPSLISFGDNRLTLKGIVSSWIVHIIFLYGLTIIFLENDRFGLYIKRRTN